MRDENLFGPFYYLWAISDWQRKKTGEFFARQNPLRRWKQKPSNEAGELNYFAGLNDN